MNFNTISGITAVFFSFVLFSPHYVYADNLHVKTLVGISYTVEVDLGGTVRTVKNKVFKASKIPPPCQRLLFEGQQLEENKRLQDYGIQADSTLLLMLHLKDRDHCPEILADRLMSHN